MIEGTLQAGQAGPQLTPDDIEKLKRLSLTKYGSALENLSEEQKQALFTSYEAEKLTALDQLGAQGPQGKMAGGIYVAPTWSENAASAIKKGIAGHQLGQIKKQERVGREASAGLLAESAATDRAAQAQERADDDERRKEWLAAILAR
jgi:hypothetical protein